MKNEPAEQPQASTCVTESVSLRAATPDDESFLFALYASTRAEEIAAWGWDEAQRNNFLRFQFMAQRQHYEMSYPQMDHEIILFNGTAAGRIMVFRSDHEIILVDIALLPEQRGLGAGTVLIQLLLEEARHTCKPLRLHVTKENRARRLYARLGLEIVEETETHFKMEYRPAVGEKETGNNA